MNGMLSQDGQTCFVFGISRASLTIKELANTIETLSKSIGIEMGLLRKYFVSDRNFEKASSIFAEVSGDAEPNNFGRPIKLSIEDLGYFLPCSAEVVSFIFYNAPTYAKHFPQNLICGIRKDIKSPEEVVLVLKKDVVDGIPKFTLEEIPATKVPKQGFEILLVKEHPEDPE